MSEGILFNINSAFVIQIKMNHCSQLRVMSGDGVFTKYFTFVLQS